MKIGNGRLDIEPDRLGGHDPYSSSKAGAEIAIASWRSSFCGPAVHQNPYLRIATARAGNVIGGGDWSPDPVSSQMQCDPWFSESNLGAQSGEPLGLGNTFLNHWEAIYGLHRVDHLYFSALHEAFNFGPSLSSNRPVSDLVASILQRWPGEWLDQSDPTAPHEANRLHLQIDKAHHRLGWQPCWDYEVTMDRTVEWYRAVHQGASPFNAFTCRSQSLQ